MRTKRFFMLLGAAMLCGASFGQTTWNYDGNTLTASKWFGTINNYDLIFKRNSVTAGFIGTSNTAFGVNTANVMNTGTFNSAFGLDALKNNTTGTYNTALGYGAYCNNKTGSYNVGVGSAALSFNPFTINTNNGSYNIGIGFGSGVALTSGSNNILVGINAGNAQTTGSGNVIIGSNVSNTNSTNNVILADGVGNKCLWVSSNGLDLLSAGSSVPRIRIKTDGKVLIGDPSSFSTNTAGTYKLYVADGILTEKIKVAIHTSADWADYVFAPDYNLLSLDSVETYINLNNHLPGIPSSEEMIKTGSDLATTDKLLLQKIEELTLYMIELKKQNEVLQKEVDVLKSVKN